MPDPKDFAAVQRWVGGRTGPTAIDLFAGAGGLSAGLQAAGFSVLVGADNDKLALESHVANIGGLGYARSLTNPEAFLERMSAWGITHVDLLAAGLPCQPFSQAGRSKIRSLVREGKRRKHDPRTRLWRSFLTIVDRLRPNCVLIENVPELAVWRDGELIIELRDKLRELGYRTEARILSAAEHGVPQRRQRLFVVGMKRGISFVWPRPARREISLGAAIGDLPSVKPNQRLDPVRYRGPITNYQRRMRRGLVGRPGRVVYDHITRALRADDEEAFKLLKQGGIYKDLPKYLQRYRTDIFHDKYKRLVHSQPSRAITAHLAKDGYWYIHPIQHRTLSVREAARLQSFPDRFRFAGTPTHRYRQIGNAVPPLLAEAIGAELWRALRKPARATAHPDTEAFRQKLLAWHAKAARTFPWRAKTVSPWKVLMAEMCLHRTRAGQALPVYRQLAQIAPSPNALVARAPEVRSLVRTLGLHWRGRNLIAVARALVHNHGGRVPRTETELKRLPGIGEYAARAVLSFAFGKSAVILDTNTTRIVGRVREREKPRVWQTRLDLYDLAGRKGADAAFNYALLDLGALICRPKDPLCGQCPVRDLCDLGRGAKKLR
jgi:DNA (cytosine-5)-methyltransferase 1